MTDQPEDQDTDESAWEPKQPVIPSTWLLADFGDAFAPVSVNQRKVPAKAYKTSGALPVVDQGQVFIGGYTDDESLAVDPGEGLIVFGDHTRVFKRVSFRFAAGADGIKVLRPLLCDSAYAYYACKSLQFPNRGYSRHYSFLARCKLPIAPESEQKRIVSKIDELFSRIDEGERALERVSMLVERYRQSVLQAAVTGELTREWREKNKDKLESGGALLARILKARREAWEKAELAKMKANGITPDNDKWKQKYKEPASPDAGLPELPDGWTWASLGQLTKELDQGWSPQCASEPATQDGQDWGVIKTTAVQAMRYEGSANKALPSDLEPRPSLEVQPGDLLVTRAGPRSRVGIACLVRSTRRRLMICDKVYRLRVLDQLMSRDYVEIALNSPPLLEELEKLKSGINDSGLNLTQERFLALTVPLPSLAEQTQIADVVAEAGSQVDGAATYASVSGDSLRQAVLKLAFSGKLVTQSDADEPASTLLERIAAERATVGAASPRRGRRRKSG